MSSRHLLDVNTFNFLTGQIKWEKNIGVPPIPFTGIPFTTEGSTTYQCVFGPKRAKMSKENHDADEDDVSFTVKPNRPFRCRRQKRRWSICRFFP